MALEAINAAAARDDRRLGRPDRFEQHQNKGPEASDERGLFRPLHLLRHPRVRHGRGDERHGAARRRHPLWRHLPDLLRLLPAPRSACRRCSRSGSIYVMTHDSIGLGEDGPTHQPIEHLMSLRAMPNLDVYRPADAVETAECWALALRAADGPSVLALTRQNLPQLRTEAAENLCARGAYRLRAAAAPRKVVLLATGSEVEVALAVGRGARRAGDRRRRRLDALLGAVRRAGRGLSRRPPARRRAASSRSRPARRWAGSAIPAATASTSASTGSAPRRPAETCSSVSASPPRRSCRKSSRRSKVQGDQ